MASNPQDELLGFPADLFADLPCETRLHLELADFADEIVFASVEIPTPDTAGGIAFDGPEIRALVAGVDADRVWPEDFRHWVNEKQASPEHRVTLSEALAGAIRTEVRAPSLGEVLERLGLRLVRVEVRDPRARAASVRAAA